MKLNVIIGFLVLSMVCLNCKKGDEDPFISLRSRKARITFDWKIYEFSANAKTENNNNGSISNYENRFTLSDGSISIYTSDVIGGNRTYVGTATENTWSINKDFSWERTLNYSVQEDNVITYIETIEKGDWSFLNKTLNEKKKETIVVNTSEVYRKVKNVDADTGDIISTEEQTETFPIGYETLKFELIELSSKQVYMINEHEKEGEYTNDVYYSSAHDYNYTSYILRKE